MDNFEHQILVVLLVTRWIFKFIVVAKYSFSITFLEVISNILLSKQIKDLCIGANQFLGFLEPPKGYIIGIT
jgi:hypothetical protein